LRVEDYPPEICAARIPANLVPGFGLWVSGFGIRDSGFGIRNSGFGFRVSNFELWVSSFGLTFHVLGFSVLGRMSSVYGRGFQWGGVLELKEYR